MERATIFGCEAVLMLKISGEWYEIAGALKVEEPAMPKPCTVEVDVARCSQAVGIVSAENPAIRRRSPDADTFTGGQRIY